MSGLIIFYNQKGASVKGSKKDKLIYDLVHERRSRLKPHEKELDISGTKSYLACLNSLLKMHTITVNRNIIQREVNLHAEKLIELEKSMRHVGIYLSDIGRWLQLEGYAKESDFDGYIEEINKYSAILIENAESRKKTVPNQ